MAVIFFDIDGTLATEDERAYIPESTRKAISETRRQGNLTFINSGRTAFNINPKVKELGFDGYLLGCGTYIEYNGKVLFMNNLEQNFCRKISEIMHRCKVTPVYEYRDCYFFDDKCPKTKGLEFFMNVFVSTGVDVSRRVEDDDFVFDKFVIWKNEKSDMELFQKEISPYFSIIDRGEGFFENVPLGFSKATAIEKVLELLDIPLEQAYAVGDSNNDLPMLQAVPNSIAMGGAEMLYPFVSYVTTSIENDGIWNALKHFRLI